MLLYLSIGFVFGLSCIIFNSESYTVKEIIGEMAMAIVLWPLGIIVALIMVLQDAISWVDNNKIMNMTVKKGKQK
jgi:hypothetical protein